MKKIVVMITLLFLTVFCSEAFAFGGCEENCQKCHSLSKEEAQQILIKLNAPDARPVDVRMSPIKGLWEVSCETRGSKGIMYVGFSKHHVIYGPIFEVDTGRDKTRESFGKAGQEPPRYADLSGIPLDSVLVMGEKNAQYRVVVFTDPDCPYCGKLHGELKKILSERKDMAFFVKLMPLSFHPDAYWKSKSILCKKSIQMLEDNFEKKEIPRPDCETKEVDANIKLAAELGITGTPTLIMPDGLIVMGAFDAKALTDLVLNPRRQ
jgi:thiol:disulfide interchange protein DsbC